MKKSLLKYTAVQKLAYVWTILPCLLLHLLLSFCFDWEDISNTRDSVSSAIQTSRKRQNTLPRVVLTPLSVFGYPSETLSFVFDILRIRPSNGRRGAHTVHVHNKQDQYTATFRLQLYLLLANSDWWILLWFYSKKIISLFLWNVIWLLRAAGRDLTVHLFTHTLSLLPSELKWKLI